VANCMTCGNEIGAECGCCRCICAVPNPPRADLEPTSIIKLQERLGGSTNPKDLIGRARVQMTCFPPIATIHGAHAMMDGVRKYGPYNWRDKKVSARVYLDAAKRHLDRYFEGENVDPESGAHPLGHAMACLAIILDAMETGNLIDDRPTKGAPIAEVLTRLNKSILEKGLHLSKEQAQ
jgi:hypothetical protein